MSGRKNSTGGRERAVLMMPTVHRNPYHALLAAELRRLGWRVALGKRGPILPLTTTWLWHRRPQILHLHWTHALLLGRSASESRARAAQFRADLLRLRARGVKFVWTIHNLVSHDAIDRAFEIEQHRWLVSNVDAVTVHCEAARLQAADLYDVDGSAFRIVPHGAYVGVHPNDTSRAHARASLRLDSDAFVYLFLGDIKNYKGVGELIEAFGQVDATDARLVIAGSAATETSKSLVAAAQRDARIVVNPERVADDELQTFMNAANVVVLPFRNILTSGSTWLAMSFGRALIVPRIGCVAESVDERGATFLPAGWSVDDLREAMVRIRERDTVAMGDHNLTVARQQTWDISARALNDVFESL